MGRVRRALFRTFTPHSGPHNFLQNPRSCPQSQPLGLYLNSFIFTPLLQPVLPSSRAWSASPAPIAGALSNCCGGARSRSTKNAAPVQPASFLFSWRTHRSSALVYGTIGEESRSCVPRVMCKPSPDQDSRCQPHVILALLSSGQKSQNDSGFPNPVLGSYPRTFPVSGCNPLAERIGSRWSLVGIEPTPGQPVTARPGSTWIIPQGTRKANVLWLSGCWPFIFITLWSIVFLLCRVKTKALAFRRNFL